MKKSSLFVFLALLIGQLSCAPVGRRSDAGDIRVRLSQRVGDAAAEEIIIPFEIDEEIKKASLETTRGVSSTKEKMMALLFKILSKTDIDLHYDQYKSYSAIEAYREGKGNCLSFTNLFIGMARSIGIPAFFVEVLEISDYELLEGLVVNQRHICAGYYSGTKVELVDFSSNARKYLSYKVMDDFEAIASFYNNLGYDALREDRIDDAVDHFMTAIRISPEYPWGYNNLGVALSRKKDFQAAIHYYERSIALDPDYEAPYGNLANLFLQLGEKEKGEKYLDLLDKVKSKNPYHRISRGLFFKEKGDLDGAVEEMKKAIFLDRRNVQARVELAKICIIMGKAELAERYLKKALKLSPGNPEIERLLSSIR